VTVIDLGVPADHKPGPPPVPRWLRDLGVRRPLIVVLAAAICLALLGAAAPAEPGPVIHRLTGVPGDSGFQISGETLIALTSGPSAKISVYSLSDGAQLWSRQVGEQMQGLDIIGDRLVVHTSLNSDPVQEENAEAVQTRQAAGVVTGYDVTSGEARWSRPGGLIGSTDHKLALLATRQGTQSWLEAVTPTDGTTVWRRTIAAYGQWLLTWQATNWGQIHADRLVELATDGTVTMIDTADGQPSATGHIEPGGTLSFGWQGVLAVRYGPPPPVDTPTGPGMQIDDAQRSLSFYDLANGFTFLWKMSLVGAQEPGLCSVDTLCDWSTAERRLDLRTGVDVTAQAARQTNPEQLRVGRFGVWNIVSPSSDFVLVYADPGTLQRGPGWLGKLDTEDPSNHVSLLVQLPGRIDQCTMSPLWLVCSDSATSRTAGEGIAYAVRRADLDRGPHLR
jgi:hypothetical protein